MPTTLTVITLIAYLAAFNLLAFSIYRNNSILKNASSLAWGAAVLVHALLLSSTLFYEHGLNLSFYNAISTVTWLISALLYVATFSRPVQSLGLVVLPLVSIGLILGIIFPEMTKHISQDVEGLNLHIFSSLLAYAFLSLAVAQALILAYQDHQLRHHQPVGLVQKLPPLQHMESLLFQLIAFGFVLLSIALISGFIFLEDMLAQQVVHKTVLSIISWLVFSALLWGRWKLGWRGRKAIRWTLWGFAFLALAYFGSKIVRELILQRA